MALFGAKKNKRNTKRNEPQLFNDGVRALRADRKPVKARRGFLRRLFGLLIWLGVWGAVAGALGFGYVLFSLNERGLLKIPERQPGIMILASNGSVLSEEGAFYGDAAHIADLPDYVPNAVIAIEDRRFRSHFGIDPLGLGRAMLRNVLAGRMVQGGSTLTQQLAKNLFLTQEKTATRKAQEAVLALWLESKFNKDEILQLYLNRVYFGSGAYGIEQAARTYYNKSANELSIMEAATLAGVLKAPSNYNPAKNPGAALTRAKLVVNAMVEEKFITADDAAEAVNTAGGVTPFASLPAKQYAVDWITRQLPLLVKNYDQSIIVETTIDPTIQANAERALRKRLADNGKKMNVSEGAMVVMDPTGAVVAMLGGKSYQKSQYNRAIAASRQPGSAFKPFVYEAAMENGFTPDSTEIDEPVRFGNWQPENYKQKYQGTVSLEQAFAQSINTVAAKLAVTVGTEKVAEVAQRFGITSPLTRDASLALGTSEVSPLELITAYAPFANGGTAVQPYVVRRIVTRDGQVLYERKGDGLGKVISDNNLGEMNRLFRAVVQSGTGVKAQFGNFDIGGKTGTSQNYRDAWFVGFTPYLIAGVWMGNDDNTPTKNVTGGSLPAQVWRDVMEPAHQGLAVAVLPGYVAPNGGQMLDQNAAQRGQGTANAQVSSATPTPPAVRKPRTIFDILFGGGPDPAAPTRKKPIWEQRQDEKSLY
ncbi:MAG: penicillin-binding protein 1A [Alphaproteobacteria bacterium]|nr:penicillin-binding protein 1A [Alphaproteobacteria bacterium]